MRKTILALALSAALPVIAQAAEEAKSPHSLTGNVTFASEYIYRGIGQTNRKPAVQAGFDYGHSSGIYLGTWGSNVSWVSDTATTESNSVELDFYGGYKGSAGDIGYDVGVLQYYYPGTYSPGFNRPHTTEGYVSVGYKTVSLKYSHSFTDLFGAKTPTGGDTKGSGYIDLSGSYEVGAGVTVSAHVGYQKVADFSDASYTDWKLGASKEIAGLTWGLAYIGTNAKGDAGEFYHSGKDRDLGANRVVATVGKTF